MVQELVQVPVDVEGLTGNVAAELRFALQNPAMAELQVAAIWLQVREAATPTP